MKARTKARGIALQVLYEYDVAGHQPLISLEFRLEEEDQLEDKTEPYTQFSALNVKINSIPNGHQNSIATETRV